MKTLWNYEPFSRKEAWRDQLEKEGVEIIRSQREEAEKRKVEAAIRADEFEKNREQRKAKWQHVARSISYTATEWQIYYLLDLGVSPRRLNGITNTEASDLIARIQRKL